VAGLLALNAGPANSQNEGPIGTQATSSDTCLFALTDPRYPAFALDARIMGPTTATFDVDTSGNVVRLESKGHPLLAAGAEEMVRSARFNSVCWGRRVEIRFLFRISGDIAPETPVSARAISATEYEIVAPAKVIEVTTSDPAWLFTRKGRFLHRVEHWLSKLRFW